MELRYWLVSGNVKNNRINWLNEKRSLIPWGLRVPGLVDLEAIRRTFFLTMHLTNRMWFSVVCTVIHNEYESSQRSKCCGLTRWVSPQLMYTHEVSESTIDVHSRGEWVHKRKWKFFFQSASWKIEHGKLANQIARLVAIVANIKFETYLAWSGLVFWVRQFLPQ